MITHENTDKHMGPWVQRLITVTVYG